eukprot:TRINITY_DN181_c0_g1_i1.p1 TRINITY_DN181_c0_g1~~TRINITY_DN181_c0_g1_i1.p1  ORF type:complete len:446 (-),score=152.68 TRINITY_DN181_c0_g1_i1:56-1393(-)
MGKLKKSPSTESHLFQPYPSSVPTTPAPTTPLSQAPASPNSAAALQGSACSTPISMPSPVLSTSNNTTIPAPSVATAAPTNNSSMMIVSSASVVASAVAAAAAQNKRDAPVIDPTEFQHILTSKKRYPVSMANVMKWLDYTQRSSLIALMKRNFKTGVHYIKVNKVWREARTYYYTLESFKTMMKLRRNGGRRSLADSWTAAETLFGSGACPDGQFEDDGYDDDGRDDDATVDVDGEDIDVDVSSDDESKPADTPSTTSRNNTAAKPRRRNLQFQKKKTTTARRNKKAEAKIQIVSDDDSASEYTTSGSESSESEEEEIEEDIEVDVEGDDTPSSVVSTSSATTSPSTHAATPSSAQSSRPAIPTQQAFAQPQPQPTKPASEYELWAVSLQKQWMANNARIESALGNMDTSFSFFTTSSPSSWYCTSDAYNFDDRLLFPERHAVA